MDRQPDLAACLANALPEAEPFAAVPLLVDLIPLVDPAAASTLLHRVVANAHPSTWDFTDARLDGWPPTLADDALAAIRALPTGEQRIDVLCQIPARLTVAEKDEVLAAIMGGSFPETTYAHTKPLSRREQIFSFVRDLAPDCQEAFIVNAGKRAKEHALAMGWTSPLTFTWDVKDELEARIALDRLDEASLRDFWARIPHDRVPGIPIDYSGLAPRLPADLRVQALARIRSSTDHSRRLSSLAEFDSDLTDVERHEVVAGVWLDEPGVSPSQESFHLRRVAEHLPLVEPDLRRRWLDRVLSFDDAYHRQVALLALLPSLTDVDHDRATDAIRASVRDEGHFHGLPRWDLFLDDELPELMARLRDDEYAWHRDGLVEHILTNRPPHVADKAVSALLHGLDACEPDTCLEIVRSVLPWLASRLPAPLGEVATLPVPTARTAPNQLYSIARALRDQS